MPPINMSEYMLARYHRRRNDWIASQGSRCAYCESTESLEIDHIDKSSKVYNVGKIFTSGNEKMLQEELAKCQVLCQSCHKAKSDAELEVPHGGGVSGKKQCPCPPCKAKKAEYNRNYRLFRKQ